MPIPTILGELVSLVGLPEAARAPWVAAAGGADPFDAVRFQGFYQAIRESVGYFWPELLVLAFAIGVLFADLFLPRRNSKHLAWVAIAGCLAALLALPTTSAEGAGIFLGMAATDPFATFFKAFFLLGSIVAILLSHASQGFGERRMGEYYFLILTATFGGMLMASATHFLMMFLSLEILSISSYVLVGFFRSDLKGAEAALKYVIYGAVASAVMAYGFSLWFGMTGSAELASLAEIPAVGAVAPDAVTERGLDVTGEVLTVVFALLAIFAGLAFKISAVPMHFWTPDVYEGAPTPVTAFLSVVSKGAGFALALRFFAGLATAVGWVEKGTALGAVWSQVDWTVVLAIVAVATMTLGNFAALWQTNLKRLFAYSSIAHAGYILLGVALLRPGSVELGLETVGFYLAAYLTMNFGAFAAIILVENRTGDVEIESYRGLSRRDPFLAVAMAIFLFSLIGVPPTAGFMGKFQLFLGAIDVGSALRAAEAPGWWMYYALVLAAVLNTAVSAYYYLRIAKAMYFDAESPAAPAEPVGTPAHSSRLFAGRLVVIAMVALTFYLCLRAEALLAATLNLQIHL